MVTRIAWVFAIGVVVYVGYKGVQVVISRINVEVVEEDVTPIEERILLDVELFPEDFGKKRVIQLRAFDEGETVLVDFVSEPRPTLERIIARYGPPEGHEPTNLSQHGIRQEVAVSYYGRLGLATPIGQKERKVFWVILR
jgi:hypothetical protein